MDEAKALTVKAPGRICLFGEHQDYLGLPVVAAAINRYITIEAVPTTDSAFCVDLPDVGEKRVLPLDASAELEGPRDYLVSSMRVLSREGCRWRRGYDVRLTGDIPQRAGVSSSSALVVAWIRFLLQAAADARVDDPLLIARLAHAAEVVEFGEPGGMMDHFAASFGGMIYVDTVPPYSCRRLHADLPGLILCYSGEPKATLEVLSRTRAAFTAALGEVPDLDVHKTTMEELLLSMDSHPGANLLRAQWNNRELTREGIRLLEDGASPVELGRLLTAEHEQLRELGVSTPRIDSILDAALMAGATGGKVNGSGGGGCLFVLAPGREAETIAAMERAGGTAWQVEVVNGGAQGQAAQLNAQRVSQQPMA